LNLLVEIEFDIGPKEYMVRRGIKPNVFEIYLDGSLIDQDSSSKDYQENFEQSILKIGYRSFTQIVVLGSANHIPFMQLPAQGRREVVEDLLDIQIFSVMNSLLKERVQKNKDDLAENSMEMRLTESKIELARKHLDAIKENNEALIKDKEKYLQEQIKSIEECQQKADEYASIKDKLKKKLPADTAKYYTHSSKLYDVIRRLDDKMVSLRDKLIFYKENNVCPACNQVIEEGFAHEILDNKQKQLEKCEEQVGKVNDAYQKTTAAIKNIERLQTTLEKNSRLFDAADLRFEQLSLQEQRIRDEIDTLRDKTSQAEGLQTDEQQYLIEMEVLSVTHQELMDDKELLTTAAILLKDGGIKTKIIRQYVPVMNNLIGKYLAAMDFFVQFELDENFSEKILSRYRDEFSYGSFSEGEKFRIDIALLFTWRAVAKLRNRSHCNLLILDEIFDGSLDVAGTEEFLKIIYALAADTNIFMISHSHQVMSDRFDKVLEFEKTGNFTEIAGGVQCN